MCDTIATVTVVSASSMDSSVPVQGRGWQMSLGILSSYSWSHLIFNNSNINEKSYLSFHNPAFFFFLRHNMLLFFFLRPNLTALRRNIFFCQAISVFLLNFLSGPERTVSTQSGLGTHVFIFSALICSLEKSRFNSNLSQPVPLIT